MTVLIGCIVMIAVTAVLYNWNEEDKKRRQRQRQRRRAAHFNHRKTSAKERNGRTAQ